MNNQNRFRQLFALLCVAAPLAFTACGGGENNGGTTTGDAGAPVQGDWVIIHSTADPEDMRELVATDASQQEIISYIYDRLMIPNWETLEPMPWLADSLPVVSADHLTYDFRLKKNAKFSDGQPVTGNDFIFTLKAIKNPEIKNAGPLAGYYERVKSAELINGDPYHIRFTMREPYFLAADYLGGLFAMPKHILDPQNLTDKMSFDELNSGKSTNPVIQQFADWYQSSDKAFKKEILVGSGPYMFDSYKQYDNITLVRNPNYWNKGNKYGTTYPDKIIWKTIQENVAAVNALRAGEIDVIPTMPKVLYKQQKPQFPGRNITPAEYDFPSYNYVGYNQKKPLFQDKLVRQALARAINREEIVNNVYFGFARAIQSPIFYKRPECDTTIPIIKYNLEEAKKMLADAGWSDSDGDGILDKVINGQKTDFKFTIMLTTASKPTVDQIAQIFISELKKIGIEASTKSLDWAIFLKNTRAGDYDAYIGGWAMDITEGDNYQLFHSKSIGAGSNYVFWRNPTADSLIQAIRTEFDKTKRFEITKQFQQVFNEDQPYNLLVSSKFTGGYSSRYQNVTWYAPRPCFLANTWWVPLTAQKYKAQQPVAMN